MEGFDIQAIRRRFPFFTHNKETVHYLDNGATTQKPNEVIDVISEAYSHNIAPVGRGLYSQANR